MISYPSYTAQGILVKTQFNPDVVFGGRIEVQSSLLESTKKVNPLAKSVIPSDGIWAVYSIDHALDSMLPNGKWESDLGCYNPAFPEPIIGGS